MEITENFIEKLLIEKDHDESVKVKTITLEPAVGKGENFMSVAVKIQVQGTKLINNKIADFSKSLFLKKQFDSKETTDILQSDNIFGNEALAYNEIVPVLEECLGEKIAVAKCYSADKKHVILEDLFAQDFKMIEGQKSLTLDQCCAVLKELANLHSASYILKSKNPQKFEDLTKKVYEIMSAENNTMALFMGTTFDNTIKILKTIIPETKELKEVIKKIEDLKPTIVNEITQLLNKKTSTDVFNHGDCWMNNLLFKNATTTQNSQISIKLVDLQIMRCTSPAADLSYFLYINILPTFRKEKLDFLLTYYLKQVHTNLKKHNLTDLIKILDLKWIKNEMRSFSKFGLTFGLMIFPIFYVNKQALPEMEKMTQDMMDQNIDDMTNWMEEQNNQDYHKVLMTLLRIYFEEYDP